MKFRAYIIAVILILNSISVFAQDSTKPKTDTVKYKPLNFILSDYKYQYLNQTNPDTVTRSRFLWYPAKNLEDIFNYLPGYYLSYMDVGQLNPLSYDQLDFYNIGVLRNGRLVNDMMDGSIDYNLFSRNEIAEIEFSGPFANNLYQKSNTANVIQRQIFQNRPYTEISFIQDRYENLFFDGDFHQNLFRNLNFNFGITKHSYDGKYVNSDFDKWLGRFNLNFAASNKLNFFAYVNYATIQKGLNEGLNPDTINLGIKEQVFDPVQAIVRNSDSYEKKERFDIDIGAVFLPGKTSFTKLQFFESNSFREYRDEENRLNSNNILLKENYHWITYGVKLKQMFSFNLSKKLSIHTNSEAEYNYLITSYHPIENLLNTARYTDQNMIFLLQDITANLGGIYLTGYFNGVFHKIKNVNNIQTIVVTGENYWSFAETGGLRAGYELKLDSLRKFNFEAYTNLGGELRGVSLKFTSPMVSIGAEVYENEYYSDGTKYIRGLNASASLRLLKIDLTALYSNNFSRHEIFSPYPEHFGTAEISFHDISVKGKLEYKIGLTSKFWSEYSGGIYSGRFNRFSYGSRDTNYSFIPYGITIPANASLDFFIMGKIGRATFGLTMENILDRVIYNTGVYPNTDRGGLANIISRFNITWNFLN